MLFLNFALLVLAADYNKTRWTKVYRILARKVPLANQSNYKTLWCRVKCVVFVYRTMEFHSNPNRISFNKVSHNFGIIFTYMSMYKVMPRSICPFLRLSHEQFLNHRDTCFELIKFNSTTIYWALTICKVVPGTIEVANSIFKDITVPYVVISFVIFVHRSNFIIF